MAGVPGPEAGSSYEAYFRESALRFACFYNDLAQENQDNFSLLDVEFNNILAALDIFEEAGGMFMVASTIHAVDVYCDGRGYWQTLRRWLETAWENRILIKNDELVFRIVLSLANLVSSQGDRSSAETYYQHALELASHLGREDLYAEAYLGYGVLLLNTGRQVEAIQVWQRAKQMAENSKDLVLIAGAALYEDMLGVNASASGEVKNLRSITQDMLRNFGEMGEVTGLMFKATMLLEQGQYTTAQPLFSKALSVFQESGEKQGEALAGYNLGLIAQNLGDLAEAFRCFHNSLAIAQKLNDQTGLTGLYYSLGLLHLQRQEFEPAREFLKKCVSILRRDGDKKMLSEKLYWYGYALANSGQVEKAIQVFLECQSMSSQLGTLHELNPEKELETLRGLQGS